MSVGDLDNSTASDSHGRTLSARVPPLALNSSSIPMRQISISAVLPQVADDSSTESSATSSLPHPTSRKSASHSVLVRSPRISVALQEAERRRNSMARPLRPHSTHKTSDGDVEDRMGIKWEKAISRTESGLFKDVDTDDDAHDDDDDSASTKSTPSPALVKHIEAVLALLGAPPSEDGRTSTRAAKALSKLTQANRRLSPPGVIKRGLFANPFELAPKTTPVTATAALEAVSGGMVTMKDIPFTSICEQHMLPFSGQVSICYIPRESILGLSKFVRIVRRCASSLQTQEKLTVEIAEALDCAAKPLGVFVAIEAMHSCIASRGVRCEAGGMITRTSSAWGLFRQDWTAYQIAAAETRR